jgi:hypothetical protein
MSAHILGERKKPHLITISKGSIVMVYTNWKGMTQERYVTPITGSLRWHEGDKFHPTPQWVFDAWDHEKRAIRTFTMKDIKFPIQTGDL